MTVLFADCRNYTAMTRELGVERMAPLMDTFFRSTYEVVVTEEGILDKFLGDACLALFNVPVRRDDHVARAVKAACQVQHEVVRMNAARGDEPALEVGIAISTGFALAGRLGSNEPSDYTAIGDVVNIASRLQGHAGAGELLVTGAVYEAVRDSFPDAERREYELKGVEGHVAAYLLRL